MTKRITAFLFTSALASLLLFLTPEPPAALGAQSATASSPLFTDVTASSGIDFIHHNGMEDGYKQIPEDEGAGAAWLDYDLDGDMDLYLVNSNRLPGLPPNPEWRSALYRNNGDGTFTDVTEGTPLGTVGYGQGAAVGDYDNDGDPDLFVTFLGPDRLFRNDGAGKWTDVSQEAGVATDHWTTSASFLDYDLDGDLDLFACGYIDWSFDNMKWAVREIGGKTVKLYVRPAEYKPTPSFLYRNNGDGTFTDVSVESGIASVTGNAFVVLSADFDKDGYPDCYVANDMMENYLFHNKRDGTFEEVGLITGAAYGGLGEIQNGMGGAFGDLNNDGWLDLVVSNHQGEPFSLYFGGSDLAFEYASDRTKLTALTFDPLGWAALMLDYDHDSDLDLFFACGHVENVEEALPQGITFAQPDLLLANDGNGVFSSAGVAAGDYFSRSLVSRSAAHADYDNDGDLDLIITTLNGPAVLLRNDGGNRRNWIMIDLEGTRSNRDGIGATIKLTSGGGTYYHELNPGQGYCSSNDPRIHFGLGDSAKIDEVRVRWPSGTRQILTDVPVNRLFHIKEEIQSAAP